jgi:hypothetical protein
MKKILLILVGLAIILAGTLWLNLSNNSAAVIKNKDNRLATLVKKEPPHLQHLVSYQQAEIKNISSNQSIDNIVTTTENIDNILSETPFSQSETAERILKASGKLRDNLRGEVYLDIDNDHISSLAEGDTLNLDIPFFGMYQDVTIESTQLDSRGNKTINASFPMNDDIYTTTITINERAIYGHIETPHGIYSLAGNGQYAWMAEAKDLVHDAVPDQIGGNPHDGSADPQPITETKPEIIKGK